MKEGRSGKKGGAKNKGQDGPPPLPALEELEALAASAKPTISGAWWVSHQVTEHVLALAGRTDPWTGAPLPQSLMNLLNGITSATATGCRPFPRDQLFVAAEFAAAPLVQLIAHHRHRIIRSHEQLPFHRLREVDTRSLAWLARQPGRNIREKLSGRTRALGVKRELTSDTTENRLLRTFAKLLLRRSTDRIASSESYDRSEADLARLGKLKEALRLCDDRMRRSELADVPTLSLVQPNNVLLSDPAYSRVFRAWKWLRDEEVELSRSWPDLLNRVLVVLFWLVAARLASTQRVRFADRVSRVVGLRDSCALGIEAIGTVEGESTWLLNPEQDFLVIPLSERDSAFQIRLSLHNKSLIAKIVILEGLGLLKEASAESFSFELLPEPEFVAAGRGLPISVQRTDSAQTENKDYADLAGLRSIADRISRQVLARCEFRQIDKQRVHVAQHPITDGARIGLEFANSDFRLQDDKPIAIASRAWSVAVDLPGSRASVEWLDGQVNRFIAAGIVRRSLWAMGDILDPETNAPPGTLALACSRLVSVLAEELHAPTSARIGYAVPDSIDEFSQRSIRTAVGTSFGTTLPVWRSVASAMSWQLSPSFGSYKARPGDHVVVVDTEFSAVTVNLLVARYDAKLERMHPASLGLYWERKPPLPPNDQLELLGWQRLLRKYAAALVVTSVGESSASSIVDSPLIDELLRSGAIARLVQQGGSIFAHLPPDLNQGAEILELRHDRMRFRREINHWVDTLADVVESEWETLGAKEGRTHVILAGGPCALRSAVPDNQKTGRIVRVNRDGSGVIRPDDGSSDLPFPSGAARRNENEWPWQGQNIEFAVCQGSGGPQVDNVAPVSKFRKWGELPVFSVPTEGIALGVRECLLRRDSGCVVWKEWLPELSLEVVRDGHFAELPLLDKNTIVDPFLGAAKEFDVPVKLILAPGQAWYSFPLIVGHEGRRSLAWEARVESTAFPLTHELPVVLKLSYHYGLETSYRLTIEPDVPEAPFQKLEARWVSAGEHESEPSQDVPVFPAGVWDTAMVIEFHHAAEDVDRGRSIGRRAKDCAKDCWGAGRSLSNAPTAVTQDFSSFVASLSALVDPASLEVDSIPIEMELLTFLHEDCPQAIAELALALDYRAGDTIESEIRPDGSKRQWPTCRPALRLLGGLVGNGSGQTRQVLHRLLDRLKRHTSLDDFNLSLTNETVRVLLNALWRDPQLAFSISDAGGSELLIGQAGRTLYNLLTRIPTPTQVETPAGRDRIGKLYWRPFRDACEILYFLLQIRERPDGYRLRTGTASADSLAKAIRQLDSRFANWDVDRYGSDAINVVVPESLHRMSRIAFVLNEFLSDKLGANLVQVVGSEPPNSLPDQQVFP